MARMREPVGERIVREVAAAADSDALELPTLYDVIDPEALESLVRSMADGEVSFTYAGYEVTVGSDGRVCLDEVLAGCPAASFSERD